MYITFLSSLSNKSDSNRLLTQCGGAEVLVDSDVSTLTEDWVVSGAGVPPLGSVGSVARCEIFNSSSTPTGGK